MATVDQMGTSEWLAGELNSIRVGVSSYIHEYFPLALVSFPNYRQWTRAEVERWLHARQPAVRILIAAAFGDEDKAISGLVSYSATGIIYAF